MVSSIRSEHLVNVDKVCWRYRYTQALTFDSYDLDLWPFWVDPKSTPDQGDSRLSCVPNLLTVLSFLTCHAERLCYKDSYGKMAGTAVSAFHCMAVDSKWIMKSLLLLTQVITLIRSRSCQSHMQSVMSSITMHEEFLYCGSQSFALNGPVKQLNDCSRPILHNILMKVWFIKHSWTHSCLTAYSAFAALLSLILK